MAQLLSCSNTRWQPLWFVYANDDDVSFIDFNCWPNFKGFNTAVRTVARDVYLKISRTYDYCEENLHTDAMYDLSIPKLVFYARAKADPVSCFYSMIKLKIAIGNSSEPPTSLLPFVQTRITSFCGMMPTLCSRPSLALARKGFGYVIFADRESLVQALDMTNRDFGGRSVRVEVARGRSGDRSSGRRGACLLC